MAPKVTICARLRPENGIAEAGARAPDRTDWSLAKGAGRAVNQGNSIGLRGLMAEAGESSASTKACCRIGRGSPPCLRPNWPGFRSRPAHGAAACACFSMVPRSSMMPLPGRAGAGPFWVKKNQPVRRKLPPLGRKCGRRGNRSLTLSMAQIAPARCMTARKPQV